MKSQRILFAGVGVVTVLALVSFALVSLGSTDNSVHPTSLSADPGGSLALYRLLESEGVPIERLFSPLRKDRPDIGMVLVFQRGYRDAAAWGPEFIDDGFGESVVIVRARTNHVLPSRRDYHAVEVTSSVRAFSQIGRVGSGENLTLIDGQPVIVDSNDLPLVAVSTVGSRTYVEVGNGAMFLNRFLGHDDNAKLLVSIVKSLLPEGKKLALPEYVYGVTSPDNLFTRLGPAYSATLIQLLLMLVLAIYTLGRRFGYPDAEVPTKPGTGDFVRALGEAFRRAKGTDIVLETELRRALRRVSQRLNLPADLTVDEKLARVPGDLGATMRSIYSLRGQKPSDDLARRTLGSLERLLSDFESSRGT